MSNNRFGSDIILSDGDIVFGSNGDFFTTENYDNMQPDSKFLGYYNISFSLLDRLNTPIGSNPFHPEYGSNLHSLLSSPNAPGFSDIISEEISETLISDPRVKSVKSISVTQKDNTLNVEVFVELIETGQTVNFVFPGFVLG